MGEIRILYEDADIICLYKPAGVVVHHDARHMTGTIVDWVGEHYQDIRGVGDPERPGIVHRLDKDTSGALLIARTQGSFEYLKKLFQTGGIQKTYTALVVGSVRNDTGVIDEPIARSTKHFEKRVVGGKQGRAREAVTEYRVTERFGEEYTLLDAMPKTGRTHQIRSHLAHLGYPIVGDKLYGGKRYMTLPGLERQFLHAFSLDFTSPEGKAIHIEAPLAPDLVDVLKQLRK